jgi:hypothetical protein
VGADGPTFGSPDRLEGVEGAIGNGDYDYSLKYAGRHLYVGVDGGFLFRTVADLHQ